MIDSVVLSFQLARHNKELQAMLKPGGTYGEGDEALEFYAKHTAQIEVSHHVHVQTCLCHFGSAPHHLWVLFLTLLVKHSHNFSFVCRLSDITSVLAAEDCDMFWRHNWPEACDDVFLGLLFSLIVYLDRMASTFGMFARFPRVYSMKGRNADCWQCSHLKLLVQFINCFYINKTRKKYSLSQ